jgi:diacylglycerol kinase family enzyme
MEMRSVISITYLLRAASIFRFLVLDHLSSYHMIDTLINPSFKDAQLRDDSSMRVVVILNKNAGWLASNHVTEKIALVKDAFHAFNVIADVRLATGKNLKGILHTALKSGPNAIAVGGGDGTIGTAAAVLSGGNTPLGVLPLGTFNHLAKDLGIPSRLKDAVQTIAAGIVKEVDLAEVNGEIFVNGSTIGIYADYLRARNPRRVRVGLSRWLTVFYGMSTAFRNFPMLEVHLNTGNRTLLRTTPFVLVGNNEYDKGLFSTIGGRSALNRGHLSVYVARCSERSCMARLVLRVLTGHFGQYKDLDSMLVQEVTIHTPKSRLLVTTDGELRWMSPPIHYKIRPMALRVLLPIHRFI